MAANTTLLKPCDNNGISKRSLNKQNKAPLYVPVFDSQRSDLEGLRIHLKVNFNIIYTCLYLGLCGTHTFHKIWTPCEACTKSMGNSACGTFWLKYEVAGKSLINTLPSHIC